jgi:RNA exonuclease NGL2
MLPGKEVTFTQLLEPPKVADLGEGLPRKGISASDHLPVACEIAWTA